VTRWWCYTRTYKGRKKNSMECTFR